MDIDLNTLGPIERENAARRIVEDAIGRELWRFSMYQLSPIHGEVPTYGIWATRHNGYGPRMTITAKAIDWNYLVAASIEVLRGVFATEET